MIEYKVEIECDIEVQSLFKEIEVIAKELSKSGIFWHTLTYFEEENFWRFDWEYRWNGDDKSLKKVLEMAIEAGRGL